MIFSRFPLRFAEVNFDNGSKSLEILPKLSEIGNCEEYEVLILQIISKGKGRQESLILPSGTCSESPPS